MRSIIKVILQKLKVIEGKLPDDVITSDLDAVSVSDIADWFSHDGLYTTLN